MRVIYYFIGGLATLAILAALSVSFFRIVVPITKEGSDCRLQHEEEYTTSSTLSTKKGSSSLVDSWQTIAPPVIVLNQSYWDSIECPEKFKRCDLTDPSFGIPTLLICRGRSGSTITWTLMSSLAGGTNSQSSPEDTGGSPQQSLNMLNEIPEHVHGKCWLEGILCARQSGNRSSVVYGTKWKSYVATFEHPKVKEALQWLAAHPSIRLIHLERNPVDLSMSLKKHNQHLGLGSHCRTEECVKNHTIAVTNMTMSPKVLATKIKDLVDERNFIRRVITDCGIRDILDVKYEELYNNNNNKNEDDLAVEWMRIFRYLGAGPTNHLTNAMVAKHMPFLSTSPQGKRSDRIKKYDKLVDILKDTPYAKYLDEDG